MRRTTIRVPIENVYIKEPFMLRLAKILGVGCVITLGYLIFMVVAIEFVVGCGERTYHADGTWRTNECVFIPYEPVEGRW